MDAFYMLMQFQNVEVSYATGDAMKNYSR